MFIKTLGGFGKTLRIGMPFFYEIVMTLRFSSQPNTLYPNTNGRRVQEIEQPLTNDYVVIVCHVSYMRFYITDYILVWFHAWQLTDFSCSHEVHQVPGLHIIPLNDIMIITDARNAFGQSSEETLYQSYVPCL